MATINAIIAKIIERMSATSSLGLKSVKADISPQSMIDAMDEMPAFPAAIVNYAGRIPTREGSSLVTAPTFAIFIGHADKSAPYVSGSKAIDVIENLVESLDGQRVANEQKGPLEFAGDELIFQNTRLVLYQVLFRTQTVHARQRV